MSRTIAIAAAVIVFASASAFAQVPVVAGAVSKAGTKAALLSTIKGNAVNSSNGSLTDAIVRLRDARYGKIVSTVMTNKQGLFTFEGLDPGSYVVEVMTPAQNAVMMSSQVMNIGTGEVLSTLVKLPFRIPPIAGLLGNSTQTTTQAVSTAAQAVTAAATSSNTVAQTLAGEPSTDVKTTTAR